MGPISHALQVIPFITWRLKKKKWECLPLAEQGMGLVRLKWKDRGQCAPAAVHWSTSSLCSHSAQDPTALTGMTLLCNRTQRGNKLSQADQK